MTRAVENDDVIAFADAKRAAEMARLLFGKFDRGVDEIRFNQLENRGHHRNIQAEEIAIRQLEAFDWCERMFNQMYILHDGRAVQCCADWEQSAVMGGLTANRLEDVWKGLVYTNYRKRFLKGDVKGMLCDGCTKDGGGDGEDD